MDEPNLDRQLLDAIPHFLFLVDEDVRILAYNAAAANLLGPDRQQVLRRRGGEVLHCLHATDSPQGCGRSDFCEDCPVRSAVTEALAAKKCARRRGRMELLTNHDVKAFYLLVTASPLTYEERSLCLLLLEDIGEIIELQRIIPICTYCKKVRDDAQYWSEVEAYLKRHLDLQFTHGMCPDCFQKELAKLKALGPRSPDLPPAPRGPPNEDTKHSSA
ncbi:MAG: PAS domain-containing protein [Verrucomicrobiota bacterium]|jgi:hypothetical protein